MEIMPENRSESQNIFLWGSDFDRGSSDTIT